MTKENVKIPLPRGDNFDLHSDPKSILDWWRREVSRLLTQREILPIQILHG